MTFKQFDKHRKTVSMSLMKGRSKPNGVLCIVFSVSLRGEVPDNCDVLFGQDEDFGSLKLISGEATPQTRKIAKKGRTDGGLLSIYGLTDPDCVSVKRHPCEFEYDPKDKSFVVTIPKVIIPWLNIPDEVTDADN